MSAQWEAGTGDYSQPAPWAAKRQRYVVIRTDSRETGEKWVLIDLEHLDGEPQVVLDRGGELLLKAIAKRLNADPPTAAELSEPF